VKLCTATEEAIVNVITYAFSPEETAFFDIEISVSGMDFIVTIRDKGKPYDFSSLELNEESWEGLGVKMMQGLTDKVEFRNLGFEGRSQSLIKHLADLPLYQKRDDDEPASMPEHIDFDIHPLKKEEAIEVAQCIYDEFGYTYLYEIIYYPQQFYEACQRGEIYSLVATYNGEVAGHLALKLSPEFPGIAEMGIGVVKRKFRKYSMMNRLTEMIIHQAQHVLKLNAMFAQPVAYHTITQKMCGKFGFAACNFALHCSNDEFATSFYIGNKRSTFACAMLPFTNEQRTIYLPDEVLPMMNEIIGNMNLNRQILKGKRPNASVKSVGTLSINQRMRLGKYFIEKTGDDITKELKNTMLTLKQEKCAIAEIVINLSDPAAPYAYQSAKKINFFCTGIMPQTDKGDYLVMECLMNDVVNYGEIKTVEPFTSLLEHIRKLDPNEN
jgi:serine/threonine-protein kinase RsbW